MSDLRVLYVVPQPPDAAPGRGRGLRAGAVRGDARDSRGSSRPAGADRLQRRPPAGRPPGHAVQRRSTATRTSTSSSPRPSTSTSSPSTSRDKALYSRHLTDFLLAQRPDVVHLQHTHFIGLDLLSQIRRVLPDAAIVYTLHEFLPICHRHGQMVRTFSDELCGEASPRRCHECFPEISPQSFFLRERFVKGHFENVDRFLAPSAQLMDKYLRWGIEPERIEVEEYGRLAPDRRAPDPRQTKSPANIGFFGQLSHFKGAKVMLEAMALLDDDVDAHLWLHGANLELQTAGVPGGIRRSCSRQLRDSVTFRGPYDHARAAEPDGGPALGPRPVDLVGELAAGDPGGLLPPAAGHLQRRRRHGGEGPRRRRRAPLPRRRRPTAWRGRSSRRPRTRGCGARCATASASRTRWTPTLRGCWTCTASCSSSREEVAVNA